MDNILRVPEATKQGYCEIFRGGCVDLTQPNSKTRRGRKMEHKSNCLTTQMNFYQYIGPVGCAMRGRYIDRENGGETIQHMEARNDKKANAVTTVTKDSMVALPLKVSNQGKKIEVNESGKSVCVVTRGNVGWTNMFRITAGKTVTAVKRRRNHVREKRYNLMHQ